MKHSRLHIIPQHATAQTQGQPAAFPVGLVVKMWFDGMTNLHSVSRELWD